MKHHRLGERTAAASHFSREKAYWLKQLTGISGKRTFPYDFHNENKAGDPFKIYEFRFSPDICSRLTVLSKGVDYMLHMILAAALALLLDKYTYNGSNDIVVGAPIYRQETTGDFVNTVLALRIRPFPELTFKDLLLQVKETITQADHNQNYPLETLLKHLGLPSTGRDFPLFDTAILVENIHDKTYLQHIYFHLNTVFSFVRTREHVLGAVEYNSRRYKEHTIKRIVDHFSCLLQQAIFNPDARLAALAMMTAEEKYQVLFSFNNTLADYPLDKSIRKSIHRLFEESVVKTPDRTGIVGRKLQTPNYKQGGPDGTGDFPGNLHLTYLQLNILSNRLARFLQTRGVGPGALIALMMDNSVDLIIGILGILKAGGAYLPINPEDPVKRILALLKDSSVSILLLREELINAFSYVELCGFEENEARLFVSPGREQVKDLDSLQIPDRSPVDYEKYSSSIAQAMVTNSISLQFSRGCVYNCAYCFKIWSHGYVNRSAENMFEEIHCYYRMGIRRFGFVDDLPNFNVKESARLFRLIIRHGLKVHLHFPNGLRGDILTRDYIDLMVEAGTIAMDLALETSSPRLQRLIRKNLNLDKLRENMEYIINTYPGVILGTQLIHGLPSETQEEARESLEFIKSLKWLHFPYIHLLTIYPNTGMAQLALEHGISPEEIRQSAQSGYHEIPGTIRFPPGFTRQYQAEFMDGYFMSKERLLAVLPWQMKALSENELVQKYNNYLPMEINWFQDLLCHAGISRAELKAEFLPADFGRVPGLNRKIQASFPVKQPLQKALRVMLLDLSQHFSTEVSDMVYRVKEPPLGLMYLLSYLNKTFSHHVHGKIAKSGVDFDDYDRLEDILIEFKPEVIGVRSLNFYKEFFHKTIALIRQWGIHAPVIAGGPYATSSYVDLLKDAHVDLVVCGEGEITFAEIIGSMLENNKKLPGASALKKIAGIAFREEHPHTALKSRNREILLMDRLTGPLAKQSGENLPFTGSGTDPAYVIYTSGSTGVPKGVMVQHNNLVNQVTGLIHRFVPDTVPPLNFVMLAPFTFDVSVMHIFLALLTGGKLYLIDEKVKKDSVRFWQFIDANKIDVLNIVPAFMQVLLGNIEKNKLQFKYLFVGGDVFPVNLYHALKETFKTEAIFNIYGPTETTINALLFPCNDSHYETTIPIGKPLSNYQVYILDVNLEPVPIGIPGELHIGGIGLSRGYLNQPGLTMEKFINYKLQNTKYKQNTNPKLQRIYRTGDLGRWLLDGNIEFLGRIDHQVKIRGFRIELGEIQKNIIKKAGVLDAVVIVREDKNREKNLYAYIVSKNSIDITQLREFLAAEMPGYMIPSYFIRLERIPLTPNGTVDIKALPEVQLNRGDQYEAPGNEFEKQLVPLWVEVLEIEKEQISINSNFFELGGHSLRATILTAKIQKTFHVNVPLAVLFRTPTVKGISAYIKSTVKDEHLSGSIVPIEKKEYYRCSFTQKQLYIGQQMKNREVFYNMPTALVLEGEINPTKLETTFRQLIQRHENLRTSFILVDDEPVQRIQETMSFEIEYDRNLDFHDNHDLLAEFVRPFQLWRAPLLRTALIKTGENRYFLMIDMHHIITDGISTAILINEFTALYAGNRFGLPWQRVRYKDFSQWRDWLYRSGRIKKQEEYWSRLLAGGVPKPELPLDYPRPAAANREFTGDEIHFVINNSLTARTKRLVSRTGTTLHMMLLAVFTILISKYSGQEDIVVGTGVSGRKHGDLEHVMGMFVNMLPMRNQAKKNQSFLRFLEHVKTNALDAYENQDYPFEELEKQLNRPENTGNTGVPHLFDTVFQTQNVTIPALDISGLTIKPYTYKSKITRFDLIITAVENQNPDTIDLMVGYSTELFSASTIGKIYKNYLEVLTQVLENNAVRLQDITISNLIPAVQRNKERDYWINKLSGYTGKVAIPYDSRKKVSPEERHLHHLSFGFSTEVFPRLIKICNNSPYQVHMLLVAGLIALLYKYNVSISESDPDIVVGIPIYKQEIEGEFINTVLPIRSRVKEGMTFKGLLLRVKQAIIEAEQHQDYPLDTLLYQLNITAAEDDDFPLFDTVLLLENLHDKAYLQHIRLNMIFSFSLSGNALDAVIEYNPLRYLESTIKRAVNHFSLLIEEVLFDIETPLQAIEMISDREKQRILNEFNSTTKPDGIEKPKTIVQLFEEQVKRVGDKTALVGIRQGVDNLETGQQVQLTLTYRELNTQINRWGSLLRLMGIRANVIVGLMVRRSIEMVIGLMAILKAGGAYFPIDGDLPENRVISMLRDVCPPVLVTVRSIIDKYTFRLGDINRERPGVTEIVLLDQPGGVPVGNLDCINRWSDMAYVISTSGSTGTPRGAVNSHSSVCNLVRGLSGVVFSRYDQHLNVALAAPVFFDASVKQVFGALLLGHSLFVIPEQIRADGEALWRFYVTRGIDIADASPTLLRFLLESLQGNQLTEGLPVECRVKQFLVGGEILGWELVERFFSCFGRDIDNGLVITNVYGLTECSADSTAQEVSRENFPQYNRIPIGKPLINVGIYILDKATRLLPIGIWGEIHISGAGIGKGYLNRPEKTATRFVTAFNQKLLRGVQGGSFHEKRPPGRRRQKLYKTGDLARWSETGIIEFLGRIDRQVSIRGYRIEIGEIETWLIKRSDIKEAVVIVNEDRAGDKYLCAYYVPVKPGAILGRELRQFLVSEIPDYMLPSYFICLDRLPITRNGKLDIKALPEPGEETRGVKESCTIPEGSLEQVLAGTWAEVLGLSAKSIGREDNFFERGGHSLKATILVSRLRKIFNVKVPLAEVFKSPTVRQLAGYIREAGHKRFVAIPAVEKRDYYLLTSVVKRLYLEQQMDLRNSIYNISTAVELTGKLDRQRLQETFGKLIVRHESLRTSYRIVRGEPVQRVHEHVEFEIEYDELSSQGRQETGGDIFLAKRASGLQADVARMIESFNRPFNFARAPLLRVGLVKTGESRHILVVTVNHMAADGTSLGLIVKDFMALYEGKGLLSLRIQYKDFSEWQITGAVMQRMKKQEEYWLERFKGEIPVLELPLDFPRPEVRSYDGAVIRTVIAPGEIRGIVEFVRKQEEATLYMVMLTIFYIFLFKLSGQEDIIIGTPMAGRKHADLEPVLGMFVNTIALRNFPAREKTVKEFFQEVRSNAFNAFENQDFKFENLVQRVVTGKDLSRSPLMDVFFAFQNMDIPEIEIPGLKLSRFDTESNVSRFDMGFHVFEDQDQMVVVVEYCTKLFKKETMEMFIANFKEVIGIVIKNWDIRLADINVSNELLPVEAVIPAMELGF